jgi:hypothetical protein
MTKLGALVGRAALLLMTAMSLIAVSTPMLAESAPPKRECTAPADLVNLEVSLQRLAKRIVSAQPIKIVAIGSSSTAGAGASSTAMNYPSRLAAELGAQIPRVPVTVVNRGVNGEEARDMLARFETDVFAERPDLVVWQVGSNSVLRDRPLNDANAVLREGLRRLRGSGADVVVMNPQYAPKVIVKKDIEAMIHLIDVTVKQTGAGLFQRYAVMRYWRLTEDIPFAAFTSADDLHMNDWSYGCIAKFLADAIYDAAMRPKLTATASPAP